MSGLGRLHLVAVALLVAVLAVWATLMIVAARDADLEGTQSGTVTVLFPPGYSIREVFLATEAAGGSIVTDTWLPNLWVLNDETPGYAARLREAGAWLVLDTSPFMAVTVPTCGGI